MVGLDWLHRGKTVLTAAGVLALQATTVSAHNDHDVVVTETGPLRGVETSGGNQYLGIPYAAPPVGSARWMPPMPAERWHGLRDASQFGSNCPQVATPFGLGSQNEDCLYLNVFTPDDDHRGRSDGDSDKHGHGHDRGSPVMVWLHPGAFQYGESDDFDPTDLVEHGVVVVTLNYRLGALGFLAHPALTAESASASSGNYGLQDQQAALRWVQRNIERFGGDPDNVTIFGESAGAVSVHAHMASPASAGLFQRAIAQSGGYALTQPTLSAAEAQGTAYAAAIGCASQDAACLRGVPVATLLANQSTSPTAYLPKVDGSILPVSVGTAFATGQFNRVPVIEGSTHDEFSLFVASLFELRGIPVNAFTYTSLISAVLSVPPAVAQVIATNFYPLAAYPNAGTALTAVGTDAAFACNTRVAARLLSQWVPTWVYEFNDPTAPQIFLPPVSFAYNAYHGSENQYLFDMRESVPAPALTPQQEQLSASMQQYWTGFAKNADPNSSQVPQWNRYQPSSAMDAFQSFNATGPAAITGTAFGLAHKCAVWGSP
jgi:para-nitrobenzyl esterase